MVSPPSRSFVQWLPRPSPGDSQSVLSLVTFFGRAKKVTRLPAGTGEVEVIARFDFERFNAAAIIGGIGVEFNNCEAKLQIPPFFCRVSLINSIISID
jgi:hypothetical protein